MKAFLLFVVLAIFFSCSNNSAISKKLSDSDSLIINFTAPASDSIVKTVVTTEPKAIKKLIQFVNAKEAEQYKCGYDGELLFFSKGNTVSAVAFKYAEEECRHFLLDVDGKLQSTKMSNEAVNFLKGLAEGRNWY